jgi:pimeloyl-ACP methyl ester carboxylesterase
VNQTEPLTYGDGFKPHPLLLPYSSTLENFFYFDSINDYDRAAVVLVHGNGDEADTWRHVFTPLSRSFRVLALDLPGFGRSKPLDNGNIQNLTSGISSFINALGLSKIHLVGSSLGAIVCALYASQHPERTASLTLVGGAFVKTSPSPEIKSLLEPETGENYYNGLRSLGIDAAFATLEPYYANFRALPTSDLEFLRARVWSRVWSDTQRDAFFAALRSLFDPQLSAITGLEHLKANLIWGEHDNIMPIQTAHATMLDLTHAKLEVIAGAGHLPHQEQPQAFLNALEPFLVQVEQLEAQS